MVRSLWFRHFSIYKLKQNCSNGYKTGSRNPWLDWTHVFKQNVLVPFLDQSWFAQVLPFLRVTWMPLGSPCPSFLLRMQTLLFWSFFPCGFLWDWCIPVIWIWSPFSTVHNLDLWTFLLFLAFPPMTEMASLSFSWSVEPKMCLEVIVFLVEESLMWQSPQKLLCGPSLINCEWLFQNFLWLAISQSLNAADQPFCAII